METAISIPEESFEQASRRPQELGLSRSEFFSRAARRCLAELEADTVTDEINRAVDAQSGADNSAATAVAVAHRLLGNDSDEW